MDIQTFIIKMYHSGSLLKRDGSHSYVGGDIYYWEEVDMDEACYFTLADMTKQIGHEHVAMYYGVPKLGGQFDAVRIHDDTFIREVKAIAHRDGCVNIYLDHGTLMGHGRRRTNGTTNANLHLI